MQTATPHRFTKKINNHPLKSGVHLQWEAEVDAFFYVRPERRNRSMSVDMRNSEGYLDLTAYEARNSTPVVRSGPLFTSALPTLGTLRET